MVVVAGALDVHTAAHLRQQFVELEAAGRRHLVVDLDGVDFLASTGLGVLVGESAGCGRTAAQTAVAAA